MQIGYGFTSKKKAAKAANFILNGGVERKKKAKEWWRSHQDLAYRLSEIAFYSMKDQEDLTDEEFAQYAISISKELGIDDFKPSLLRYL